MWLTHTTNTTPHHHRTPHTARRCASEVETVNHGVMAAAELLLGHAAAVRGGIKDLAAAVGGVAADVQAAEAMVPPAALIQA
jgi:hypothetical protein